MDFSYVHIRYFIGYVYHICLQDTIQSTLSLCLWCQAMLLPMPLRPLLLTTRSGFTAARFLNVHVILPSGVSTCARDRISDLYTQIYYTLFASYLLGGTSANG